MRPALPLALPSPRARLAAAPLALLLGLALGVAACAPPPDELYNRGQRLELEGRYEEATDYYIRALQGQPDMRKARGRLHVVGGLLLERHLGRAAATPDPLGAADAYLAAERLMARTAAVGVVLDQAPRTFDADLAEALDAAVEHLIARGADHLEAGRFAEALAAFGRAERYRPSREQREAVRVFTYDTHLAWADAERAAGRYRAAFDRAEAARPFAGGDRTSAEIDALQAEALDRGSVYAAVFPLEAEGGRTTAAAPPGFVGDLDALLYDERWAAPPLFVRTADPAEVRRRLRRHHDPDERLRYPRLTAELARDLLAQYGVATTLTLYGRQAEERGRDSVTVELRGGGSGTYARIRDRVTHRAEVGYAVVDASSARVLCERVVRASAEGDVRRGAYGGRVRDLVLPSRDRSLFDEAAQAEAERAVARQLQDRLAERVAEAVYGCLLGQVR